tara:strand:- start:762 stop:1505 length:744 start_codon:yes stop_codon:yes gene_type:complete
MIIEWLHRWTAAVVGLLALSTLIYTYRTHRQQKNIIRLAASAVTVIIIQALLGRSVVKTDLDSDLVALHLAVSMIVIALLTILSVRTSPTQNTVNPIAKYSNWTKRIGLAAFGSYFLLLLGAYSHNRYFSGWPLMQGSLLPGLSDQYKIAHWLHRLGAGIGLIYLVQLISIAHKVKRPNNERNLLYLSIGAYSINMALGGVHVLTKVESSAVVTAHLVGATLVWTFLVAATALSRTQIAISPSRIRQ